jgi:hypothetical protein
MAKRRIKKPVRRKKESDYPGEMSFRKALGMNPTYYQEGGKLYYQEDIGKLPVKYVEDSNDPAFIAYKDSFDLAKLTDIQREREGAAKFISFSSMPQSGRDFRNAEKNNLGKNPNAPKGFYNDKDADYVTYNTARQSLNNPRIFISPRGSADIFHPSIDPTSVYFSSKGAANAYYPYPKQQVAIKPSGGTEGYTHQYTYTNPFTGKKEQRVVAKEKVGDQVISKYLNWDQYQKQKESKEYSNFLYQDKRPAIIPKQQGGKLYYQENTGQLPPSTGFNFSGYLDGNQGIIPDYNNIPTKSHILNILLNTPLPVVKPADKPKNKPKKSDVLDLDNSLDYLVNTRGGTRDLWGNMADTIGYHESAHTMDPLQKQIGGGPGRGIFQFEAPSLITAQNRYNRIADRLKLKPDPKILSAKSALELSPEQQYSLFLINLSESKAKLKDYADNKLPLVDLWLQGHKNKEAKGDRESFRTSVQKAKKDSINSGYSTLKEFGGKLYYQQDIGDLPTTKYGTPEYEEAYRTGNLLVNGVKPLPEFKVTPEYKSLSDELRRAAIIGTKEAAELTGVPGAVRFARSPVQSLKGAGNTIVDLGLMAGAGLSPVGRFGQMNPMGGAQYAKQGTNPLTGEGSFRAEDVEGAFNTLDAAGIATIAGVGLKAPLQQGAKRLAKSPVVDYAKEFGHSIKKGKLPTYESTYRWQPDIFPERLVEAGKTLTPLQQGLTGSWYTKYPGQLAFYMRSRPGAGNVNRIRLSDRQIANLESSMPDYAKGMSGKSGVNRVPTSNTSMPGELIVPESIRSKSVPMRFQINPIDYSPQSVADEITKRRSKLKNLLNNPDFLPGDIDRTIQNEVIEEHAKNIYIPMLKAQEQPILGIPRKYFPFKDGGKLRYARGGSLTSAQDTAQAADLNQDVMRKDIKKASVGEDFMAGLYGVGEGLLDTVTFGLTDELTDAGFKALQAGAGHDVNSDEAKRQAGIAGWGNVAGAVTGAIINPGAIGSAAEEGLEGIGTGIEGIDPSSDIATGIGTSLKGMAGSKVLGGLNDKDKIPEGMQGFSKLFMARNGGRFRYGYRGGGQMLNQNMGLTEIDGPSHEQGGVTLPNSGGRPDVEVEGPETIYTPENYVMSEKMKASKEALEYAGITGKAASRLAGKSYADLSKSIKSKAGDKLRPADPLSKKMLDKEMKRLMMAHEYDREAKRMKDEAMRSQMMGGSNIIAETPEERAGGYNMYPNAESIAFPGNGATSVVPTYNNDPIMVTGADGSQQMLTDEPIETEAPFIEQKMAQGGKMIKRADGSYSKRGLWDNIRANRGSGRKPTKQMLEQEAKIKAAEKAYGGYYADGGSFDNPGFRALPELCTG